MLSRPALSRRPCVAFTLVLLAICGGTGCWSEQASLGTGGAQGAVGTAGFSPDGRRLLWGVFGLAADTRDTVLRELRRDGAAWSEVGTLSVVDAGWVARISLRGDSAVLGAPDAVDPLPGGVALQYGRTADGWELQSVAHGHGRLTSVSDDGQVLSSETGVARKKGLQWVTESSLLGTLSGDGAHLVSATPVGGQAPEYGTKVRLQSFSFDGTTWNEEANSLEVVGAPLVLVQGLSVSRNGQTVGLSFVVVESPGARTGTGLAVFALDAGQWVRGAVLDGGVSDFREIALSADGATLAAERGVESVVSLLDRGTGRAQGESLTGALIAFSPDGNAAVVEHSSQANFLSLMSR